MVIMGLDQKMLWSSITITSIQDGGSIPFIHVYSGDNIIDKSRLCAIMEIRMEQGSGFR